MPIKKQLCTKKNDFSNHRSKTASGLYSRCCGFTFTELIIVITIVGLFAAMVQLNFFAVLKKNTFRGKVQDFISAMNMACRSAAQSDKKYEMIVDIDNQKYMLREITAGELYQTVSENVIISGQLGDNCIVDYIWYDDDTGTNEGKAFFPVNKNGWQYGGKIVFSDESGKTYSVVVNRINRTVELVKGDARLLTPKADYEISF
jgi:prepilin-type N-terminal cleavage/methylation domain-containing protein